MGWAWGGGGRSQICSLEIIPFLMGKRGKRPGNYLQTLQEMDPITIHQTFMASGGSSRRSGFGLI